VRHLPWIDAGSALTAGVVVLLLRHLLADWYGLPVAFLTVMGAVNLAYAAPGLILGWLRPRPAGLLSVLIAANLAWGVVCAILAAVLLERATVFGLAHLVFEGLYVAGLGALEWRHRRVILGTAA